ncbi:MAG: RHS repeat protein, partial [Bacteroidia bacterium]|nr:RHS repeat protein [Bacteroidia bacterium]
FDENEVATDDRYIIYWANSEINVYDPNTSAYITKGIYDQFNKSGNTITITKKDQVQFIFENLTSDTSLVMYLLTEIKDRNNNSTVLSYETGADLVFINYHDTVSHPMKRINHVQAPSGRQLLFSYKPNTNLIDNVTDPLSRSISFDYTNGTLTTFTDAKGQTTTYNYGNIADPKENYLLMSITLPKGNVIYNTYNKRKLVTTKYNSEPPTQINLNTANNGNYNYSNSDEYMQATITDPMNRNYDYKTNDNGLTTSFTGQDINCSLTYPTTGANATKPTNVNYNSIVIDYEYDSNGNVTKITKPGSITEDFTYNSTNDLLTHKDPRRNITTLTYDGSLGLSTTYNYDNASRITSVTKDALTTNYQYDENDNPTQTTDALNQTIQYQYDTNDNMTKIINQKDVPTDLAYNAQDMLITETFGSSVKQYSYNNDGLLASYTKPGSEQFNYVYDAYGRMTSNSFITNTVYDSKNNITEISNSNGTLHYVYDNLNRITKITDYYGNDVEYSYDNASNITQIKYPGNKTVDYVFDANNRMTSLTDWNGKTVSYAYRADGLLLTTTFPNGITCSYAYDAAGRLTGIEHKKADNTVIASYQYQLDAQNNITNETITEPCTNYPNPSTSNITLTYDNYNRIQSDGLNAYTHNTNGNITAINSSSLSYDLMDNLTSCTLPGFQANYSYDAFGDRTSATRNGQTVKYVLDRLAMPNVLIETDNSGNPINYYVYGIGLISRVKPNGTHSYYHQDYRGSIVAMTDSVANTTHSYTYDAFGNIAQKQEQDYNPFRYVGMHGVMYEDSSLYFMRARYYNNKIGRFLSVDPLAKSYPSISPYTFCANSPIMFYDSDGRKIKPTNPEAAESTFKLIKTYDKNFGYKNDLFGLKKGAEGAPISVKASYSLRDFRKQAKEMGFNIKSSEYTEAESLFKVLKSEDIYEVTTVTTESYAADIEKYSLVTQNPDVEAFKSIYQLDVQGNIIRTPTQKEIDVFLEKGTPKGEKFGYFPSTDEQSSVKGVLFINPKSSVPKLGETPTKELQRRYRINVSSEILKKGINELVKEIK